MVQLTVFCSKLMEKGLIDLTLLIRSVDSRISSVIQNVLKRTAILNYFVM